MSKQARTCRRFKPNRNCCLFSLAPPCNGSDDIRGSEGWGTGEGAEPAEPQTRSLPSAPAQPPPQTEHLGSTSGFHWPLRRGRAWHPVPVFNSWAEQKSDLINAWGERWEERDEKVLSGGSVLIKDFFQWNNHLQNYIPITRPPVTVSASPTCAPGVFCPKASKAPCALPSPLSPGSGHSSSCGVTQQEKRTARRWTQQGSDGSGVVIFLGNQGPIIKDKWESDSQ